MTAYALNGERRITLEDGQEISCTFSAGIAEWPNSWKVLEEADKELYEAKNKGRNQVCISSGPRILTLGLTLNDNRVQAHLTPMKPSLQYPMRLMPNTPLRVCRFTLSSLGKSGTGWRNKTTLMQYSVIP